MSSQWRQNNLEHCRKYERIYYKKNKKRILDYHKNHPDIFEKARQKYVQTDKGRYKIFCRRFIVKISFEDYVKLIKRPCFYCGGKLSPTGSGLDRINPKKGYVKGNVRPCCMQCNLSKNNWTEKEFKLWINRVYHHWIVRMAL